MPWFIALEEKWDKKISATIRINRKKLATIYLSKMLEKYVKKEKIKIYFHINKVDYQNKVLKTSLIIHIPLEGSDTTSIDKVRSEILYQKLDKWWNSKLFNLDLVTIFLWSINENYKSTNDTTTKYMFQTNKNSSEWIKWVNDINFEMMWFYRKFILSEFRKWYNESTLYYYYRVCCWKKRCSYR